MDLQQAKDFMDSLLSKPPVPCSVRFWDDSFCVYGRGAPFFCVHFRRPDAMAALLSNPSLGFGQAYVQGDIEVEGDLRSLLELTYKGDFSSRLSVRQKARAGWFSLKGRRSPRQSRKDIQSHYDRGNDFYSLWLDKGMNYSCAYFKNPAESLEMAQARKIRHSLRKLRPIPGQKLLDIGCGWGSLIIEAARSFQLRAVGLTLSRKQYEYAGRRIREAGLENEVQVRLQDYREIKSGEREAYDRIISIGMFEHVGRENIPLFFQKCRELLKKRGLLLLHTICRMEPQPLDPWMKAFIFPGAYIPALDDIISSANKQGFDFIDLEDLRPHYDLTIERWIERFEANMPEIEKKMGKQFVRMWRLYLYGSQMAFRHGPMHVFQVLYSKGRISDWPLTREWFYEYEHEPDEAEEALAVA